jgi:hypothetical protein
MLPAPPTTQFALTASREGSLFITTSSGEVLECYASGRDCWFPSSVPPTIDEGWTIIHPCTHSGPERLFISKPPASELDCIEDYGIHAEFGGRNVYAVDEDGRVWAWQTASSGFDAISWCVSGQLCGLFAALLAAAAASPLVRKTRFFDNPPPSSPAA